MGEDSAKLCHLKNELESIVSVSCQLQSIATIADTVTIYIPKVATVLIYICLSGYIYNLATALDTASIYMPELMELTVCNYWSGYLRVTLILTLDTKVHHPLFPFSSFWEKMRHKVTSGWPMLCFLISSGSSSSDLLRQT